MNKFCMIDVIMNFFRSDLRYAGSIWCNIERHYMTTPTTLISFKEYCNGVIIYPNKLIVFAFVRIVFIGL